MSTSLDYGGDLGHEKDDEVEPSDSVWQGDFRFISDEENDFERINLSLEEIQEIRSRSCQNLEEKWNYVESSAESCRDELTKLETIIQQFGSEINSLHDSLSDIELRQREVQAEKNPPFVELDDEKCQSFADVSAPYKSINNNLIIEKGHWDSSYRPTGWQEDSAKSLPPPIQDKDRPPPPCRQSLSDLPKFRHPSIGLLSLRLNQALVFTPSKPKKRRRRLTLEDFSPELKRLKSDLKVIEDHNLEQRSRNETHSKENLYIYGLPKILCNFKVWAERLTTYGKILDFRVKKNYSKC